MNHIKVARWLANFGPHGWPDELRSAQKVARWLASFGPDFGSDVRANDGELPLPETRKFVNCTY